MTMSPIGVNRIAKSMIGLKSMANALFSNKYPRAYLRCGLHQFLEEMPKF
jgi:hypothetical protein